MKDNNTVIYRHLKPNGEVFYIGIGSEKRARSKHNRSKWWKNTISKYPEYEVEILKTDLTWEDACELEKILINYYGRRNLGKGKLVNLTDGGDGSINVIVSDETREKLRISATGKVQTEEHKRKALENKGLFRHSEATRKHLSEIKLNRNRCEECELKYKLNKALSIYNDSKHIGKYYGITWNKKTERWVVLFWENYKGKYVGSYKDDREAAKAYIDYIIMQLENIKIIENEL